MKLNKEIHLIDLTIYLPKNNTLIISDVHMGYEEAMKGVMLPRFQLKDTIKRLDAIFDLLEKQGKKVNQIIITGDLKHEFGKILDQEWRNVLKFVDYLIKKSGKEGKVVLIKGNHDVMLAPVLKKRALIDVDHVVLDNVLICHGDVVKDIKEIERQEQLKNNKKNIKRSNIKTIIIGHEHCAISLRKGNRVERYKSFLTGSYGNLINKTTLIVMPSFNLLTIGTDILHHELLSPYLQGNLDNFKVYIVEDTEENHNSIGKIYDFGKLKQIRTLNE